MVDGSRTRVDDSRAVPVTVFGGFRKSLLQAPTCFSIAKVATVKAKWHEGFLLFRTHNGMEVSSPCFGTSLSVDFHVNRNMLNFERNETVVIGHSFRGKRSRGNLGVG